MVKVSVFVVAAMSAMPSLTAAAACATGFTYCGSTLLHKGSYYTEIKNELKKQGLEVSTDHVQNSLFSCGEGGFGWIGFLKYCEGYCQDAGPGNNDFCV
ncbi:hypothetical protein jhhlp_000655 [Lomentospora prolificans]|uniref:Killer toxin Kp4 domain-containing protein n=1 Tax=Lomentospora prolificans TaxID=41688 RepID=A0A2N3NJ11_9PEZI|nr:hypothetical protein jhhlp_000655 [Lomentospora prolificans]